MAKRDHKPEQDSTAKKHPTLCQERRIKVCRVFYERPKSHPPHQGDPAVPWIQMKGYWLEQAGFTVNAAVDIRVMPGCLVLTVKNQSVGE